MGVAGVAVDSPRHSGAGILPEAFCYFFWNWVSGTYSAGQLESQQADVVVEALAFGKREDAGEHTVQQGFQRVVGFDGDDFHQAVLEERLAALVLGLEHAVGEEDHPVDFGKVDFQGRVGGTFDQAESGAFFGAFAGDLADAVFTGDHGSGMTGAGVVEGAGGEVDDAEEGGGEHGGAGAFEDGGETVVEALEKQPGLGGLRALFFQQPAKHRDDERGADAVAHDVADQHSIAIVADFHHLEKVAGKARDRDVSGAEREAALVAGGRRGEDLAGERLLDLAG